MLKVLSGAYVAADTRHMTVLGPLDLSATFDTVEHCIWTEHLRCHRAFAALHHLLPLWMRVVRPFQRRDMQFHVSSV